MHIGTKKIVDTIADIDKDFSAELITNYDETGMTQELWLYKNNEPDKVKLFHHFNEKYTYENGIFEAMAFLWNADIGIIWEHFRKK